MTSTIGFPWNTVRGNPSLGVVAPHLEGNDEQAVINTILDSVKKSLDAGRNVIIVQSMGDAVKHVVGGAMVQDYQFLTPQFKSLTYHEKVQAILTDNEQALNYGMWAWQQWPHNAIRYTIQSGADAGIPPEDPGLSTFNTTLIIVQADWNYQYYPSALAEALSQSEAQQDPRCYLYNSYHELLGSEGKMLCHTFKDEQGQFTLHNITEGNILQRLNRYLEERFSRQMERIIRLDWNHNQQWVTCTPSFLADIFEKKSGPNSPIDYLLFPWRSILDLPPIVCQPVKVQIRSLFAGPSIPVTEVMYIGDLNRIMQQVNPIGNISKVMYFSKLFKDHVTVMSAWENIPISVLLEPNLDLEKPVTIGLILGMGPSQYRIKPDYRVTFSGTVKNPIIQAIGEHGRWEARKEWVSFLSSDM